jgi:hypothetical protein
MTVHALARDYLTAIERGDLAAILRLFHPEAIVHSPLYGPVPATEFYPSCSPTPAAPNSRCVASPGKRTWSVSGSGSTGPCLPAP